MSMPAWIQQYKEKGTVIKCIGGHYYKYKVDYVYLKEKKRTVPKVKGLLGKITEKDGFIPSAKNTLNIEKRKTASCRHQNIGPLRFFLTSACRRNHCAAKNFR